MGNDWTRLLQEAAKSGGPKALKAGLKQAGRLQGIWIGGLVVGAAWVGTEIKSAADQIREMRRPKTASAAARDTPEDVKEGDREVDPEPDSQGKPKG